MALLHQIGDPGKGWGSCRKISDYFQGSEKPGYSFIGLLASPG
jgi:hypothetical protein